MDIVRAYTANMLHNVAAIIDGRINPFELGTACEVFGIDRSEDGLPVFDFAVCGLSKAPVPGPGGMSVRPAHRLDRVDEADLVVIPAWRTDAAPPRPALVRTLHRAVERGATVLSVCSGVFLVAAAGLVDGRRVTCHWHHAELLRERYPHLDVDSDRLYVEDGQVVTSAGTAAGVDACLHVVRCELGPRVANGIARRMVVPPHRDGGQAQFVETPVPPVPDESDALSSLLDWMTRHLDRSHPVEDLARRVHLSSRTFARRFTAATGTTPHGWLIRQRILLAQSLLEDCELGVEEIARRVGLHNADLLRHHFTKQVGRSPLAYRRTFGRDTA